jgi:hypothetical protein
MMRPLATTALIALSSATLATTASAQRDDYTESRDANVSASGAKLIRVDARAGFLRVTGKPGINEVRIKGSAHSSEKGWLEDIQLEAKREGENVIVRVKIPEMRDNWGWGNNHRYLDLTIEVPQGMAMDILDSSGDIDVRGVGALDIEDSSGEIELADISGAVHIDDSSGGIRLEHARGDVTVSDNSGDIELRDITGSVIIDEDSSGEIDVTDVTGTVRVRRDSSGSIYVAKVGGDFVVDRDGSGEIEYRDVKGKVDVPVRRRHARR